MCISMSMCMCKCACKLLERIIYKSWINPSISKASGMTLHWNGKWCVHITSYLAKGHSRKHQVSRRGLLGLVRLYAKAITYPNPKARTKYKAITKGRESPLPRDASNIPSQFFKECIRRYHSTLSLSYRGSVSSSLLCRLSPYFQTTRHSTHFIPMCLCARRDKKVV